MTIQAYKTAEADRVFLKVNEGHPHILQGAAGGTDFQDQHYAISDRGADVQLIIVDEARVMHCQRTP